MMLTCMEYLSASKERLEDLDADMDQIRYDITSLQREIARKTEEKRSIEEQLSLTDYEEIKSRLDGVVFPGFVRIRKNCRKQCAEKRRSRKKLNR